MTASKSKELTVGQWVSALFYPGGDGDEYTGEIVELGGSVVGVKLASGRVQYTSRFMVKVLEPETGA